MGSLCCMLTEWLWHNHLTSYLSNKNKNIIHLYRPLCKTLYNLWKIYKMCYHNLIHSLLFYHSAYSTSIHLWLLLSLPSSLRNGQRWFHKAPPRMTEQSTGIVAPECHEEQMDGHVSKIRHSYSISKEQRLLDNNKLLTYFKILMEHYWLCQYNLLVPDFFQPRSVPLKIKYTSLRYGIIKLLL